MKVADIKNLMLKKSLLYLNDQEIHVFKFLQGISPCFPRFNSEFFSSTYLGLVEHLVGLFENTRTIRSVYGTKTIKNITATIQKNERRAVKGLGNTSEKISAPNAMWLCSATKSDLLRRKSWGIPVVGSTIPHPIELLDIPHSSINCRECFTNEGFVTGLVSDDLLDLADRKGPHPVYLGSKTQESSSLLRSWEKESPLPLLKFFAWISGELRA